jgi:hypothetical protein
MRGAIAMFDVLGFKEISNKSEIDTLNKLKQLRRIFSEQPGLGARTAFVSDTVVVGVGAVGEGQDIPSTPPTRLIRADADAVAILSAAMTAAVILRAGVEAHPAWAYRGCVTFGDFEIEENFYVGRAVYAAAEHYERAQGAFVWLAPDAKQAWERCTGTKDGMEALLPKHAVPLKGGDTYETYVVVPWAFEDPPEGRERLVNSILDAFGSDPAPPLDVAIKRQNTEAFLRKQLALWNEAAPKIARAREQLSEMRGRAVP